MSLQKAKKGGKSGKATSEYSASAPSTQAAATVDAGLKLGRREGGGPRANALLARRIQFLELPAVPVQPRQAGSLRRITPGKASGSVSVVTPISNKAEVEHPVQSEPAGRTGQGSNKPVVVAMQNSDATVYSLKATAERSSPREMSVIAPKKRKAESLSAPVEQELGVVISRKKVAKLVAKKPLEPSTTEDKDVSDPAVASVPLPEIPAPGPKPKTIRPKPLTVVEERPVLAPPKPRAVPRPASRTANTPAANETPHPVAETETQEPSQPPAFSGRFGLDRPPATNANHIPLAPRAARPSGPVLPTHNDPQIGVPVAQWTDDLATHATNVQRARLLHMHKPQIRRADDWDKDYDRGYEKKRKVKDGEAKHRRR
ncbi:hypothetical protein HDU86_004077 [Geranomyces michiganensis]|nr:hypothetical protein HDU86_004077 [Geranomyces michiganensis]